MWFTEQLVREVVLAGCRSLGRSQPAWGSEQFALTTYAEAFKRELGLAVFAATDDELLAAAQAEWKVKLDVGRVDTMFKIGDRVLLQTKELLDAISKLHPRWDCPFTVTACPSPNAYTRALAAEDALQPDSQHRPAQALLRAGGGCS
ncbi:MAG: hypothetical protein ACKPJJ_28665, partial [Planctomycetaceae bacterium]